MKTTVLLALVFLSISCLRASGGDDQKPFDLTTLLGETFRHCRIIKATPEGITVSHDNGVSKIPFENLNDEWKKLFHYSPDKAGAFVKEEAARRALAEEKRRQARKDYEALQTRQPGDLAAANNRHLKTLEEAIVQQQVRVAATAAVATPTQPGLLVPLPGDPTPHFGAGLMTSRSSNSGTTGSTLPSAAEVLIPATTPIGEVYTPGATGSQRFIINQGTVFTLGDGTIYHTNPGYVNPGCFTPGFINPPIVVCPPGAARPGFPVRPTPIFRSPGPTIRVGPGVVRMGP